MKKLILVLLLQAFVFVSMAQKKDFYSFKMKTLDGKEFDFSSLKGKKVVLVNTASMCGNTPQYADLQKFYEQNKSKNVVVLGFPANNFGAQEPGTNQEIKEFCSKNYSVTFPMFEKISVKGDDMAALYHWLTEKDKNGVQDAPVKWNFQKFLVDENGNWAGVLAPKESVFHSETLDKFLNGK